MGIFDLVVDVLSQIATNFVLAAVTVLLGLILGKLLGKLLQVILNQFELDVTLKGAGLELPLEQMIASLLTYTIYVLSIIFALTILGIAEHVVNIIAIIAGIIIIIYMFLGLKDFVPNAIAGIILSRRKTINKGARLSAHGMTGTVTHFTLIDTKMMTDDGDLIAIPNIILIRQPYIIHTEEK